MLVPLLNQSVGLNLAAYLIVSVTEVLIHLTLLQLRYFEIIFGYLCQEVNLRLC